MCKEAAFHREAPDESALDKLDASERDEEEEKLRNQALAKNETRIISRLRLLVFFVLAAVGAAVAATVYHYTRSKEEESFRGQALDNAQKVVDAFRTNAARRLAAIDSLSMAYTSHALATDATWPEVTLPDYERKASRVLDLADVIAIFQFPIVETTDREGWEAYSVENQGWLEDGLEQRQQEILQRIEDGDTTLQDEEASLQALDAILGSLHDNDEAPSVPTQIYRPYGLEVGPEDGPGPYFPVWQFAPALPLYDLVNYNAMKGPSHTNELITILDSQTTVVSRAFDFSDETDPLVPGRKPLLNLLLNRWKGGGYDYEDGPVSDLYYPIYDSFNTTTRKMVAVFDTLVYWQIYFSDVLPHGANAIAVLSNTCGQAFTYEISGAQSFFVGQGDLHDAVYDDYEVSTDFGIFLGVEEADLPQDSHHCSYKIHVYPTKAMEEEHLTSTPMVFTVVLVCVFFFTVLTFLVYDRLVERRQLVIMNTALKSTEVVEELFPAQVRSALYSANANNNANAQQKVLTAGDDIHNIVDLEDENGDDDDSTPNAHTYEGTVFFADVVGFTRFSSDRPPTEIFKLLEILYGAFDKIASRRKVFKVETIGDCYMCVTGVPKPQKDHAVIMARFAQEVLLQMSQLRPKLEAKLGPDTASLNLRIGLNSGPITGGVLKGTKARFQLFGDTVNTASRCESTGSPGKIQVSSSTAELIKKAGKQEWLSQREDLVQAKGKGMMQTYWLAIKGDGSVVSKATSMTSATSGVTNVGVSNNESNKETYDV